MLSWQNFWAVLKTKWTRERTGCRKSFKNKRIFSRIIFLDKAIGWFWKHVFFVFCIKIFILCSKTFFDTLVDYFLSNKLEYYSVETFHGKIYFKDMFKNKIYFKDMFKNKIYFKDMLKNKSKSQTERLKHAFKPTNKV